MLTRMCTISSGFWYLQQSLNTRLIIANGYHRKTICHICLSIRCPHTILYPTIPSHFIHYIFKFLFRLLMIKAKTFAKCSSIQITATHEMFNNTAKFRLSNTEQSCEITTAMKKKAKTTNLKIQFYQRPRHSYKRSIDHVFKQCTYNCNNSGNT